MNNLLTGSWPFFGWNPWTASQESTVGQYLPLPTQGEFIAGIFHIGAQSLRYRLYVPSSYGENTVPLVVMLHGCGQNAADFARGTRMNELAEQAQCIVLYPEQSLQANWNKCWNWYDQAHHERDEGEPALIAGLTLQIIDEYAIDSSRVSVGGLSSGGAMAIILGRTHPDVFKAVGCHSGLPHGSAKDRLSAISVMRGGTGMSLPKQKVSFTPIPTIVFHGDVDYTVHQQNGTNVVQQVLECYKGQVPGKFMATAVCELKGETNGRSFTRHTHLGEMGDMIAEQWTIHGAGHAWSGGNPHGSYTDTHGPDASKEMLGFFMKQ